VDDATRDNTSSELHQSHTATTVLPRRFFLLRGLTAESNVLAGKAKMRNKSTGGGGGGAGQQEPTVHGRGQRGQRGHGLAWAVAWQHRDGRIQWTWIGDLFRLKCRSPARSPTALTLSFPASSSSSDNSSTSSTQTGTWSPRALPSTLRHTLLTRPIYKAKAIE